MTLRNGTVNVVWIDGSGTFFSGTQAMLEQIFTE